MQRHEAVICAASDYAYPSLPEFSYMLDCMGITFAYPYAELMALGCLDAPLP